VFVNPFIAMKVLDGEMKGCDCALANIEDRPVQAWPFFAVLDVTRPSDPATNIK
jgi:hypothetical protein